jgi:hypothetical protein
VRSLMARAIRADAHNCNATVQRHAWANRSQQGASCHSVCHVPTSDDNLSAPFSHKLAVTPFPRWVLVRRAFNGEVKCGR